MSTRCNIIIKDKRGKIYLYHHHDGYPEGVGSDLFERLKVLFLNTYLYKTSLANFLVKDTNDEYNITDSIHGDIDFLYTIDCESKSMFWQKVDKTWVNDTVEQHIGKKNYMIKKGNWSEKCVNSYLD